MNIISRFIVVSFLFLCNSCIAQKLVIKYDTNEEVNKSRYIKNNDTIVTITLHGELSDDRVEIDINGNRFTTHTKTRGLRPAGIPIELHIPKVAGTQKIGVLVNSKSYDSFILDKKYCSIHLFLRNSNKQLEVTYANYIYLYQ